jgi:zinc finger protein ZPR1
VKVFDREDLDRQLVKANTCTVTIPEFELTIPAGRGQLTTIEGLFRDVIQDLSADQPLRRIQDEVTYAKIQSLVDGLSEIIAASDSDDSDPSNITREHKKKERLEKPIRSFTVILDDPTGNSFIEFRDSMADPKWSMRQYNRTRHQNAELGLASADVPPDSTTDLPHKIVLTAESKEEASEAALNANEDIFVFPGVCASCGHALDTMMKKVVIPYFKVSSSIMSSKDCAIVEWDRFSGYYHHVNELRRMWLSRQRSQIGWRDCTSRKENNSQSRRR